MGLGRGQGEQDVPSNVNDVTLDIDDNTRTPKRKRFQKTPCVMGCSAWCRKFFWEGQLLNEKEQVKRDNQLEVEGLPWHKKFMTKYRRLVAIGIPVIAFHFCWWGIAIQYNLWPLFETKYFMTITMIFGSLIAGMTSEGGGAVAFPVMTLAFSILPSVARDFSLMIQSCGMSAAAFTIFFMRVKLEWHSLILCSLGGVGGTIFGLHIVDPALTPPQKKMGFVSIWFSFAFALFLLNLHHKRKTFHSIPDFGIGKTVILLATGIIGGIFTSFAGSGLDICSFSILTLLFRVSEKVATPTSVVLMAGNTLVGFYWRGVMMNAISDDAWEFFAVCVPVVVIGAPMGSLIGTHFHRHILASLVYIIDTIALIGAFILVKQTKVLAGVSVAIIVGGFIFFFVLTKVGEWLMRRVERRSAEAGQELEYATNAVESQPADPNALSVKHSSSRAELVCRSSQPGFQDNPAFDDSVSQKL